jgi:hypothetical protein
MLQAAPPQCVIQSVGILATMVTSQGKALSASASAMPGIRGRVDHHKLGRSASRRAQVYVDYLHA